MSELTRCNYCSLQAYRRRAERRGAQIVVQNDEHGWTGVYELPGDFSVDEFRALPPGNWDKHTGRAKYKIASFMQLTTCCCC